MEASIAVLPGDGIGTEVVAEAVQVLQRVAARFGHRFDLREGLVGGVAIDATGDPLPPATRALCRQSAAILFGAIGTPKYSDPYARVKPESALLELRGGFGLYANLRPIVPHPALAAASPLRPERLRDVDILFVRELTGGIYFGDKGRSGDRAHDTCVYTVPEIERVVRRAALLARGRRRRLTSVDKANLLQTSFLWREVATRVVRDEFPELELRHVLVDSMAMFLLQRPADFDVVVTENMFGDILTDEASALTGSLGMLPSASLGEGGFGLYEPVHGSAPDIAGRGIANPIGAILSAAMLLRYSLGLPTEALAIESAVAGVLAQGMRTADLAGGGIHCSTGEIGAAICAAIAPR
jgi:3-isopropylmalate dehydrogenase